MARVGSSVSTFTYAGGRVDHKEKQFLGYAYVRATAPCIDGGGPVPLHRDVVLPERAFRGIAHGIGEARRSGRSPAEEHVDLHGFGHRHAPTEQPD